MGSRIDGRSVSEAVENLLFSADEGISVKKALKRLDDARVTLLHKNKKGGSGDNGGIAPEPGSSIPPNLFGSKRTNFKASGIEGGAGSQEVSKVIGFW